MIIDPTYIKTVLKAEEVDNQVINYLIKHFFNYVCTEVKLDTTLEEEEILTTENPSPIIPNILEDRFESLGMVPISSPLAWGGNQVKRYSIVSFRVIASSHGK